MDALRFLTFRPRAEFEDMALALRKVPSGEVDLGRDMVTLRAPAGADRDLIASFLADVLRDETVPADRVSVDPDAERHEVSVSAVDPSLRPGDEPPGTGQVNVQKALLDYLGRIGE